MGPLARTIPLDQGGEDADRAPHRASGHVRDLHARHRRRAVGSGTAHRQYPRQRKVVDVVAGAVAVRPRLSVARDRAEDDAFVALAERFVPHAEPFHDARAEALDDDIGLGGHAQEPVALPVVLEVDRHRTLVAVDRQVAPRHPFAAGREVAHVVAAAGILDLHHVGSKVGEDHGQEGSREKPGEVEDAEAVKGTGKGHGIALVVGGCDVGAPWRLATMTSLVWRATPDGAMFPVIMPESTRFSLAAAILPAAAAMSLATAAILLAGCTGAEQAPEPPPRILTVTEAPVDFTEIGDGVEPAADIEALIAPYRARLGEQLAEVLAYSSGEFRKDEPEGTLENLVADALLDAVQDLAADTVHIALLNDGGLRVPVSEGPVLMRHAYELLPFENYVTVLSLSGSQLERLADEIARSGGEPIAGWTMELVGDDAVDVRVGGQPVDPARSYRLATVDYLVDGGGTWSVLWEAGAQAREDLDALIRDVFVAYLRERDTVSPTLDGRVRRAGGGTSEGSSR